VAQEAGHLGRQPGAQGGDRLEQGFPAVPDVQAATLAIPIGESPGMRQT